MEKVKRRGGDRSKPRRRKSDKLPKLKILSIQPGGDVVECLLEAGKHSTVTFRFSVDVDRPEDIADSLVSGDFVIRHSINQNLTINIFQLCSICHKHCTWQMWQGCVAIAYCQDLKTTGVRKRAGYVHVSMWRRYGYLDSGAQKQR